MRTLTLILAIVFSATSFASETFQGSLDFEQSSILQGEVLNGEAVVERYQRSANKAAFRDSKEFRALVSALADASQARNKENNEVFNASMDSADIYVSMLLKKF